MPAERWRVAVVGAGRMGQRYAAAYDTYPDTDLVALVDTNAKRAAAACERFAVPAHYPDVPQMLAAVRPEIVSVVTPGAYFHDVVLACAASPGMRAVQVRYTAAAGPAGAAPPPPPRHPQRRLVAPQVEKPMGGPLADCDEMVCSTLTPTLFPPSPCAPRPVWCAPATLERAQVAACAAHRVLFVGGNMQVAMNEVQEMVGRLRSGDFGAIVGASVHSYGGEYLGGGCQHMTVLRRLTSMEPREVVAWSDPPAGLTLRPARHGAPCPMPPDVHIIHICQVLDDALALGRQAATGALS
jgi:hypothetical protein